MATFQQIVVNFISGCFVFSFSVGLFGSAVQFEWNKHLAPRTWSRPRPVLKNVLKFGYYYRWYAWARTLSYPDLLDGIPGTGTRKDGWSGPMLKTNLDGIVMLKYHALLMKVSLLSTILCMVIIFPVNFTAECDPDVLGWGTCFPIMNQTTFEKSTIAHIPPFEFNPVNTTNTNNPVETVSPGLPSKFYERAEGLGIRYCAIVLVAIVIYTYTAVLVRREWIDNVALRRVYYLEHDHYEERMEELEDIADLDDPEDPFQKVRPPWLPHPELRETVPNISLYSALYKLPTKFTTTGLPVTASDLERQLAATVAFFDECVPNQPGYSSSVAAVTILPEAKYVKLAWGKWFAAAKRLRKLRYIRSILQAKLERDRAKEEVFVEENDEDDDDVPDNGPKTDDDVNVSDDATNVVAAAEEEEEPKDIESQQQEPEQPSGDLKITAIQQSGEVKVVSERNTTNTEIDETPTTPPESSLRDVEKADGGEDALENHNTDATSPDEYLEPSTVVSFGGTIKEESSDPPKMETNEVQKQQTTKSDKNSDNDDVEFMYSDLDPATYARAAGMVRDDELDQYFETLGIEQLSVYAREFAQSSSNACPFGLAHNVIKFASVEKLRQMEKDAIQALEDANRDLIEARATVLEQASGVDADDSSDEDRDGEEKEMIATKVPDIAEVVPSMKAGEPNLRKRYTNSSKWKTAQRVARQIQIRPGANAWGSSTRSAASKGRQKVEKEVRKLTENTKNVVNFLDHPTYAVVTFTSRQAAIASRQCMMDGGGLDRWNKIDELPITPLADAPPGSILHCRGCCRPVTLTISDNEKSCRTYSANFFFVLFSLLYTVPLALTSQLLNPVTLAEWFPDAEAFSNPDNLFFKFLSGVSSGLLYTLFFSFCPQLFKAIANFKGNASSMAVAEDNALQYYWIFMLLTAFTGSSLANMVVKLLQGVSAGDAIKDVFRAVGLAIPTQQAPVWLHWIIVRFTYTLPFLYLFQANTFGFAIIRWQWMNRVMRGGGPGGPPPYRIYIDSGTVLLCAVALGPACPTVTPFAFFYFCIMNPMLRWLLIFVYRPKYDGGGNKWPILHEIIISTLICSQILLAAMLFLKYAYTAAVVAMLLVFPTYAFGQRMKRNFLRQFGDAGLLQTSRLDGWDAEGRTSRTKREEYRRWLVDCHKASYVPVCLTSSDSLLTAEPCVVIPTVRDMDDGDKHGILSKQTAQRGALFRRERSLKEIMGLAKKAKSFSTPHASF